MTRLGTIHDEMRAAGPAPGISCVGDVVTRMLIVAVTWGLSVWGGTSPEWQRGFLFGAGIWVMSPVTASLQHRRSK